MRRPLSFSALALFASAFCLAHAEPPAPPTGPSQELLDTACSSGLLLQSANADSTDEGSADAATDDGGSGGSIFGDAGLFGGSDDGDAKGDKGEKGEKKAAPAKKKPKTKLLRPRSDKDKADCPEKVGAFYRAHGKEFSAVPAPGNLTTAQIEGSIDHVYAVSFGPAQKQLLSDLKGGDMAAKAAVVNKVFDGVDSGKPLDDATFGTTVAHNLQDIAKGRALTPVKPGEAPKTPEELAAKAAADAKAAAEAKPTSDPLDPKSPNDPRSPAQLAKEKSLKAPPAPNAIVPPATPMVVPPDVVPTEPGRIRQFYNNLKAEVGDYIQGSPIANYEGERTILPNPTPVMIPPGSDQSVNVRLPQAKGLTPRCEPGCYGTAKMISVLVGMGEEFSAYYQGQKTMSVGGISKLGGGYFPPHVSHQKGIDADITFQGGRSFDVAANSMIVASVIRKLPDFHHINGREYILVDQSKHAAIGYGLDQLVKQGNLTPEQAARGKSVLVHWPNHNDHFHVRILP